MKPVYRRGREYVHQGVFFARKYHRWPGCDFDGGGHWQTAKPDGPECPRCHNGATERPAAAPIGHGAAPGRLSSPRGSVAVAAAYVLLVLAVAANWDMPIKTTAAIPTPTPSPTFGQVVIPTGGPVAPSPVIPPTPTAAPDPSPSGAPRVVRVLERIVERIVIREEIVIQPTSPPACTHPGLALGHRGSCKWGHGR